MIVKIVPFGERIVEVAVEEGTTIQDALAIADVEVNGRSISLNNVMATLNTEITRDASVITLTGKQKGGRK
jgi:putative ubiquitin-RnfH superfamily antitoxin RatB of RatAB toxin-antitoxin module